MHTAQVDAHCFRLRRKLGVHVGEGFFLLGIGPVILIGSCDDRFGHLEIIFVHFVDFAEQILPIFGLTDLKVDLGGVEAHRIFANFHGRRRTGFRRLGIKVEVFGERRIVVETHFLGSCSRFRGLENFRGIDVARLGRELFIDRRRRFVYEPAH